MELPEGWIATPTWEYLLSPRHLDDLTDSISTAQQKGKYTDFTLIYENVELHYTG
ncbi:hypothetical protein AJ79_08727 [Helicocarpus griseus UAMH5409]|uniref:Uncharacterized protein n=1 Tax=Helicocarpus griseus UAMH5409 TaxID=1447875 RepID=A0A2B7WQQ4_9EURO|nr:hypothetical protein AJ79_08727 [Helicocarpus griseus UAMH5409]